MKFLTLKQLFISGLITVVAAGPTKNITFNVISLVPNNQALGVIIDEKVYPLTKVNEASTLLHYGDAPSPSSGYKYAILQKDTNQVIESENFTRENSPSESTLNEYYGRSWNSYNNLTKLPLIMEPLPIINRIESDLHIDNEIPTVHFYGDQAQIDNLHNNQMEDIDVNLNMAYISPKDVKLYENVTISVSGMSTRRMSKLSYKFKLPKKQDLFGYRRIKLRAMASDYTYMRDSLGYAIAESVGLPTTKHSYVRVYINDKAVGLFGLVEHIKDEWVQNEFGNGSKKFKHGALFVADINVKQPNTTSATNMTKRDGAMDSILAGRNEIDNPKAVSSLLYLGNNISDYSLGQYAVKSDPSVGTANYTRIMDFAKFISEQPTDHVDDSAAAIWEEKIDVDSFLRGLALEIVISDMDGYFGMSNNYMLYDDIENERLVLSEQDLDLTMGVSTFNTSIMHGGNYTQFPGFTARPLTSRLFQVPKFKKQFEKYLIKMTKELVNPVVLGPRIDQLFDMLYEDVSWDLALPRLGKSLMPDFLSIVFGNGSDYTSVTNNPFHFAVYGPTMLNISMALTDWLPLRSSNLLSFFNETISQ
ncbi:coth protein-domain-containing protein [Mucor mucedo]|uniref:coth protein-domain-containing protein n=1 Tax=Mucor mucedo TaxID=29922 RepID=UPI0022208BC6|nr:coth protein-domain-containing protein [Mucor mucedo]KAI7879856.1 coth protein-domain-containing protein [Mucor mucedo]